MTIKKKPLAIAVSMATAALVPQGAYAEEKIALEEVVITAQKREQNLQDTPIAVSSFNAEALEQQGIDDIEDVSQYTPNVQIAESPGGSTGATIGIRGSITVNPVVTIDTNVGLYMDGVFIAKNVGGLFDVAELERIEILRGPQGTLYGKNTVGGAVNLVTRKPSGEFGGNVKVGVGNYGYTEFFGSVDSDTIGDIASFNVAYSQKERDGFYDNTSNAPGAVSEFKQLDSQAIRIAGLFDISEDLELYYTFDKSEKDNTTSFGQSVGGPKDRRSSGALDGAGKDQSESMGHAITLSWQLGDVEFKSITAYREMSFDDKNDYDGKDTLTTSDPIFDPANGAFDPNGLAFYAERHADQEQLSQEFQLIGSAGSWDYVAGLFFFKEEVDVLNPLVGSSNNGTAVIALPRNNRYGLESTSIAAYGQADYHFNEAWTLTLGARFTDEEKDGYVIHPNDEFVGSTSFTASPSDSWTNFSPTVILTHTSEEDTTTYIKVSEGWKSGGFNAEAPTEAYANQSFDEESVRSYELGIKTRMFEERLQLNFAMFKNEIEGLQLSAVDPVTFYSIISNAGESTMQGFELEALFAVTESLTANFSYGYLDADYDSFKIINLGSGMVEDLTKVSKFPYAPTNTASLGLNYEQNLGFGLLTARFDWSYISEHDVYHDPANAALTGIDDYDLVNLRIGISEIQVGDNEMSVSLWGKNILDEEYRINGIPTATGAVNYYGDPATYGLDVSYRF